MAKQTLAKQPQKFSARNRRALAKLAVQGMRDPSKLTFAQLRRLATVVYKQMTAAEKEAHEARRRGGVRSSAR